MYRRRSLSKRLQYIQFNLHIGATYLFNIIINHLTALQLHFFVFQQKLTLPLDNFPSDVGGETTKKWFCKQSDVDV